MSAENRFADVNGPDAPGFERAGAAESPRAACGPEHDHADTGPAALRRLLDEIRELGAQLALLWAAKIDGIKLSLRRLLLVVMLGLLGIVIAATYLVTSTVLVITGIGEGLGQLFGRIWLGHLVTGLVLLCIVAMVIYLGVRHLTRTARERTVQKYARRRERHIARSGRRLGDKPDNREDAGV